MVLPSLRRDRLLGKGRPLSLAFKSAECMQDLCIVIGVCGMPGHGAEYGSHCARLFSRAHAAWDVAQVVGMLVVFHLMVIEFWVAKPFWPHSSMALHSEALILLNTAVEQNPLGWSAPAADVPGLHATHPSPVTACSPLGPRGASVIPARRKGWVPEEPHPHKWSPAGSRGTWCLSGLRCISLSAHECSLPKKPHRTKVMTPGVWTSKSPLLEGPLVMSWRSHSQA